MAFVFHAPAALLNVKAPNGEPLVKGKEVTGFSNSEDPDWGIYVKKDGLLITGQNPASSEAAVKVLLEELKIKR